MALVYWVGISVSIEWIEWDLKNNKTNFTGSFTHVEQTLRSMFCFGDEKNISIFMDGVRLSWHDNRVKALGDI